LGVVEGGRGFVGVGSVAGQGQVFQFVASSTERAKAAQKVAELCPDDFLDDVVSAVGGGP